MKSLSWDYLPTTAMGMSADFMANPLSSTRLSPAELLMREAIQNSVDERREGSEGPVKFTVSRRELLREEKSRVVEQLALDEIAERSQFFPKTHGWFDAGKASLERLADPDFPLPVVVLSDYNTNGLGGRWNRGQSLKSRFHNLVLMVGSSSKFEAGENLLGSYGVGKMVYAKASNIRIMAYYSVFDPDEHSEGDFARFMATGFFPEHATQDSEVFTGHAFLGESSNDQGYPTRPLRNEDAIQFDQSLGFETRAPAQRQ